LAVNDFVTGPGLEKPGLDDVLAGDAGVDARRDGLQPRRLHGLDDRGRPWPASAGRSRILFPGCRTAGSSASGSERRLQRPVLADRDSTDLRFRRTSGTCAGQPRVDR
jgi:hypothetical protein